MTKQALVSIAVFAYAIYFIVVIFHLEFLDLPTLFLSGCAIIILVLVLTNKRKRKYERKERKEPHHYEKANFHVFFLCAVVFSIAYQSFQVPTLPFWNALAFALFIQIVPVLAVYADFKAMCKRRQSFEQYFPESYWSEEGVTE